jgi:hypothetical protein
LILTAKNFQGTIFSNSHTSQPVSLNFAIERVYFGRGSLGALKETNMQPQYKERMKQGVHRDKEKRLVSVNLRCWPFDSPGLLWRKGLGRVTI